MTSIPTMKWAQRAEKVFLTIDAIDSSDSSVTFTEGLLTLSYTAKGTSYKLENMPLFLEIDADESKWFRNDRCALLATPAHAGPVQQAKLGDRLHFVTVTSRMIASTS